MLRMLRSAVRTADRFVEVSSSLGTRGLRSSLGNFVLNLKGSTPTAKSLSSSATIHIPPHAHRSPPIQSTFSLPVRIALGRPMSSPYLPRPPVVPRSVTQVGLGTARNFSSSRHVFQNLVDNVPITTRALWEAEWDLKQAKKAEKRLLREMTKQEAAAAKVADKLKAGSAVQPSVTTSSRDETDCQGSSVDDLEPTVSSLSHYFASPAGGAQGVTTIMEVPLYPPTERTPLPSPVDPSTFMPRRIMRDIYEAHTLHSLRVSTIFKRLDAADAWKKGVKCDCYGAPFGSMVTSLRITFTGWTQEMVRQVIGEAGKGWCTMLEEHTPRADLSPPPLPREEPMAESLIDSTLSFVIPTLDFSSTFAAHTEPNHMLTTTQYDIPEWTPFSTRPPSPSLSTSDEGSDGDGVIVELEDRHAPARIQQSLGFSVDFLHRGSYSDTNAYY